MSRFPGTVAQLTCTCGFRPYIRKLRKPHTKEFLLFGEVAPLLRKVTLHGIRLKWTPSLFSNLVLLDYTHHGFTRDHEAVQEVLVTLAISRRLETLSIAFPDRVESADRPILGTLHPRRSVTLPCLKNLRLRVSSNILPRELAILTSKLNLPSLFELDLDAGNSSGSFREMFIASTLKAFRFHPQIRRLTVRNRWYHSRCISAFVRTLPNLRHVEVTGAKTSDVLPVR